MTARAAAVSCAVLLCCCAGGALAECEDDTFSVKAPTIPVDAVGWLTLIGSLVSCLVLICFSGLFSGLTLGLLGLDLQGLEVIMAGKGSNDKEEQTNAQYAAKIMEIRKDGNLLLCTLLLGNVAVNSLLSILSADLTGGIIGFFLSTAFVVVFGEIIPQATCSRYALVIGAKTVWLVKIIMVLMWPLAKPISVILDCALGAEVGVVHSRIQLVSLLHAHVRSNVLRPEEERVINGVLSFREKTVETVMTPIERVFMLHMEDKLDMRTISRIFNSGHSRVPVYMRGRDDIQGVLFTKDLVLFDPKDEILVRRAIEVFSRVVDKVFPDMSLGAMLTKFKQGAGHLAVVHDVDTSGVGDATYCVVGIITLEDIIEEILQDEIIDETDQYVEVENTKTRLKSRSGAKTQNFTKLQMLCGLYGDDGEAPLRGSRLALEEANVVAAHLLFNVGAFVELRKTHGVTHAAVAQLVCESDVVEVARTLDASGSIAAVATRHAHLATLADDAVYTAGVVRSRVVSVHLPCSVASEIGENDRAHLTPALPSRSPLALFLSYLSLSLSLSLSFRGRRRARARWCSRGA